MNVVWSLPVRGESLSSSRGDLVRARALIEALRADGHRVVVVQDGDAPAARARVASYRRVLRPLLPRPFALAARDVGRVIHGRAHGRRLAAVASREGAELIVETQVHFAGSGAIASRLAGVPLLLDDCSPWIEERVLGGAFPGAARRVFRTQVETASGLTVSSPRIGSRLVDDGAPAHRVHVVPNGVDTQPFEEIDRHAVRRRMGFGDEVVVCFVGSFQPWHRTELLLDALGRAPRARLRLLLVGDGPGRQPLLRRAEALGLEDRLTAPGPLFGADLCAALVASDIGALPASNAYGQPMKLLDYAAAGLAIVAADVPPVRDMIEPGVTGELVPPGKADALAAVLESLAAAPPTRTRLGEAARTRLASRASWRRRARALLAAAGAGHDIEPTHEPGRNRPRTTTPDPRRWTG